MSDLEESIMKAIEKVTPDIGNLVGSVWWQGYEAGLKKGMEYKKPELASEDNKVNHGSA